MHTCLILKREFLKNVIDFSGNLGKMTFCLKHDLRDLKYDLCDFSQIVFLKNNLED